MVQEFSNKKYRDTKGVRFLKYVIDIYAKYSWICSVERQKNIAITNAFQKKFYASCRKLYKILVDQVNELYHRSRKSWLLDNGE